LVILGWRGAGGARGWKGSNNGPGIKYEQPENLLLDGNEKISKTGRGEGGGKERP